MRTIQLFPVSCLKTLSELGIDYTTEKDTEVFCIILVKQEAFLEVYQIGLEEHKRMLAENN